MRSSDKVSIETRVTLLILSVIQRKGMQSQCAYDGTAVFISNFGNGNFEKIIIQVLINRTFAFG